MNEINLRYVGLKPRQQDCIYGTNIWWDGFGDIKAVPADVAPKLLLHPDVWALADITDIDKALPSALSLPEPAAVSGVIKRFSLLEGEPNWLVDAENGEPIDLGPYKDNELKLFARTNNIKGVNYSKRGDELRAEVIRAATE